MSQLLNQDDRAKDNNEGRGCREHPVDPQPFCHREESPGRFLEQFTRRFPLEVFWSGFALALFLLLPLAAWALAAGRPRGPARAALVALAGVPALVLLWLGIPERGAYFLGSAPFLAALSAHAPLPAGARGWALAGVLALLQGIAGRGELDRFDRMFPLGERIEVEQPTRSMWEAVLDALRRRYQRREKVSEVVVREVERIIRDWREPPQIG